MKPKRLMNEQASNMHNLYTKQTTALELEYKSLRTCLKCGKIILFLVNSYCLLTRLLYTTITCTSCVLFIDTFVKYF